MRIKNDYIDPSDKATAKKLAKMPSSWYICQFIPLFINLLRVEFKEEEKNKYRDYYSL